MEDIIQHALVPFLDAHSFLVACQLNMLTWSRRKRTGIDHAALNRYEHVLYGKVPRSIRASMMMERMFIASERRAWLVRDGDYLLSITCTGDVTEYSISNNMAVTRAIVPAPHSRWINRIESLHGIVVMLGDYSASAFCRHSGSLVCDLHRLAGVPMDQIRAVSIVSDSVFTVAARSSLVSFIWSVGMRRFVWHEHPAYIIFRQPVVCNAAGEYLSLHGVMGYDDRLDCHTVNAEGEKIRLRSTALTLRDATSLGMTHDRTHLFVVRIETHHTDVAVYRAAAGNDMELLDEVTIDVSGQCHIDGHVLTMIGGRVSARYDYRTGRTSYFNRWPQYDAFVLDDDLTATYTAQHGLLVH